MNLAESWNHAASLALWGSTKTSTWLNAAVVIQRASDERSWLQLEWVDVRSIKAHCVKVGAVLVMTGGVVGTGGSWPGPPVISNPGVLHLNSSVSDESGLTAHFTAIRTGITTVQADFVSG